MMRFDSTMKLFVLLALQQMASQTLGMPIGQNDTADKADNKCPPCKCKGSSSLKTVDSDGTNKTMHMHSHLSQNIQPNQTQGGCPPCVCNHEVKSDVTINCDPKCPGPEWIPSPKYKMCHLNMCQGNHTDKVDQLFPIQKSWPPYGELKAWFSKGLNASNASEADGLCVSMSGSHYDMSRRSRLTFIDENNTWMVSHLQKHVLGNDSIHSGESFCWVYDNRETGPGVCHGISKHGYGKQDCSVATGFICEVAMWYPCTAQGNTTGGFQ